MMKNAIHGRMTSIEIHENEAEENKSQMGKKGEMDALS